MTKIKWSVFWIALLLIIIFILQNFFTDFTEFFLLNSNSWKEIWRFATSIFLHGGIIHLLGNLFALLFFGSILEKTIGTNKFLFIFIISGILANLVAVNFYPSSLGTSGAIMGIIGALAILRPGMMIYSFGMIMPMSIAAIVWIIIDATGIFIPSNIGHIAHLSGIAFGILFGIFIRINYKKMKRPPKPHKIEVPEYLMRKWETLYMD
ncbi:MAG: rhomboid family intramembrane serine protease [Candidatus Pacearchaeota archaeon]